MQEQVTQVEQARQRAIALLEDKVREEGAKATDPYWQDGPYNVRRWVQRGYQTAVALLKQHAPVPGEDEDQYLRRVSAEVRAQRALGPDADDEGWYASAIDEACSVITARR